MRPGPPVGESYGPLGGAAGGGSRRLPVGFPDPCISIIHLSLVFFGRRMNRKIGKYLMKRTRIQFGIECVLGPLKFQLMMTTVTRILRVFMMNVKRRYFAISGSTREVGGKILLTSSKNTTSER